MKLQSTGHWNMTSASWKVLTLSILLLTKVRADLFVSNSPETTTTPTTAKNLVDPGKDDGRIIGGEPAMEGEFPFFVNLDVCGGSLVHPDIVLTAAICGIYPEDILGQTVRINSILASSGGVERTVTRLRQHPNFRDERLPFDVMVLKLNQPVSVPTIPFNRDSTVPADGEVVTVIGHGATSVDDDGYSEELLKVDLLAVSNKDCQTSYGSDFQANAMVCAGVPQGGKDSCYGDGGGPVFRKSDGVQIGIVSWGRSCALADFPGVNSRVSEYASWIERQICALSSDPPADCPAKTIICFPENGLVDVKGKGLTQLRDLQLGDMVLVQHTTAGKKYEPVHTFGHKLPDVKVLDYLKISVGPEAAVTLSGDHLVFVGGAPGSLEGPHAIPASLVEVGNTLQMGTKFVNVTDIETVVGYGLYAPFTQSGSIVVDGIRVSTFASLQGTEKVHVFGFETSITHHWLYQTLLAPLWLYCGFESSSGGSLLCTQEDYIDGIPYWLYHLLQAYQSWSQQGIFVQLSVGFLFLLWTIAMMLLDAIIRYPLSVSLFVGIPIASSFVMQLPK